MLCFKESKLRLKLLFPICFKLRKAVCSPALKKHFTVRSQYEPETVFTIAFHFYFCRRSINGIIR